MPTLKRRYYKKPEGQRLNRAFYNSHRWHTMSRMWRRKQPLCQECLSKGITTKGDCVDHIVPIEEGGGMWDTNNYQTLCNSCHSSKTRRDNK